MSTKFYKTEGRDVVYTFKNRKLKPIVDNWLGTGEVKQIGSFIIISNRAFNYVPELMKKNDLDYEVVEVSKEDEDRVKRILNALNDEEVKKVSYDGSYNFRGQEVDINTEVEFELEDGIFVRAKIETSGVVDGDEGDYYTPKNLNARFRDPEADDLEVWENEDQVEPSSFNNVQEWAILRAIEDLIEVE